MKLIRDNMKAEDRARLLQETRLVQTTRHPNIVTFYGVDLHEGDICIYMELMRASLEQVYKAVRPTPFPEPILGHIAVSILNGLAYLKDHLKIMHRGMSRSCMYCCAPILFLSVARR